MPGIGYLYDIARHVAPIAGLKGTFCGEGDGAAVRALPASLPDSPVAVVFDGEEGVVSGNAERWRIVPEVHFYVSQGEAVGASYERARSFKPLMLTRIQASMMSTEIDSVVVELFRPVEDREWPIGSGRHYFVLPCVLAVRVNKSVNYQSPTRV